MKHAAWILGGTAAGCVYLWVITNLPLGRVYALGVGSDRLNNVALCVSVAAGSSFLETFQVGQRNFEPFWSLVVAAASGWNPERALALYPYLSLMVMGGLLVSLYVALRPAGAQSTGDWSSGERGFAVFFRYNLLLVPKAQVACLVGLIAWSLLSATSRSRLASLFLGALLLALVDGLWLSALGRPYGMLTDPVITERMATVSVISATGNAAETCFAREPNPHAARDRILAWLNLDPRTVTRLLFALPLFLVPAIALFLYAHRPAESSWTGSVAVLLFWPAAIQLLPRWNLLPPASYWGDPWGAVGLALLVVGLSFVAVPGGTRKLVAGIGALALSTLAEPSFRVVLLGTISGALVLAASGRLPFVERKWRVVLGLAIASLPMLIFGRSLVLANPPLTEVSGWKLLGWALPGQSLWVGLTVWALVRLTPTVPAHGIYLLAGGSSLVLARALGVEHVPLVPALALYRLGLILCGAPSVLALIERFGAGSGSPIRSRRVLSAAALFTAGAVSPLYGYRPDRHDPNFTLAQPLSPSYAEAGAWVRQHTAPEAVFVTDSELAPLLAISAGRRFLRADGLIERADEPGRRNVEARLLGGRRPDAIREAAHRFGVTYVAINRAASSNPYALAPEDFEGRAPFKKVHQVGSWLYIFEITRP